MADSPEWIGWGRARLNTGPSKYKGTREAHGIRLQRRGAREGWKHMQEAVGRYQMKKRKAQSLITRGGNKAEIIQNMTDLAIPKMIH